MINQRGLKRRLCKCIKMIILTFLCLRRLDLRLIRRWLLRRLIRWIWLLNIGSICSNVDVLLIKSYIIIIIDNNYQITNFYTIFDMLVCIYYDYFEVIFWQFLKKSHNNPFSLSLMIFIISIWFWHITALFDNSFI